VEVVQTTGDIFDAAEAYNTAIGAALAAVDDATTSYPNANILLSNIALAIDNFNTLASLMAANDFQQPTAPVGYSLLQIQSGLNQLNTSAQYVQQNQNSNLAAILADYNAAVTTLYNYGTMFYSGADTDVISKVADFNATKNTLDSSSLLLNTNPSLATINLIFSGSGDALAKIETLNSRLQEIMSLILAGTASNGQITGTDADIYDYATAVTTIVLCLIQMLQIKGGTLADQITNPIPCLNWTNPLAMNNSNTSRYALVTSTPEAIEAVATYNESAKLAIEELLALSLITPTQGQITITLAALNQALTDLAAVTSSDAAIVIDGINGFFTIDDNQANLAALIPYLQNLRTRIA
jgi:hypothetical protein